jgi:hypothetical protein
MQRILSLQRLSVAVPKDAVFGSDFTFFNCNCSSISVVCSTTD